MNEAGHNHGDGTTSPLAYPVDDDSDYRDEMVSSLSRLGLDIYGFENASALDIDVSRLRRRTAKAGMFPPLHTVRGLGFTFVD